MTKQRKMCLIVTNRKLKIVSSAYVGLRNRNCQQTNVGLLFAQTIQNLSATIDRLLKFHY